MKNTYLITILAMIALFVSACEKNQGGSSKQEKWNPTEEELFAEDYFTEYIDPVSAIEIVNSTKIILN